EILTTLSVGAVLLAAFVAWENRVSQPMVPLRLFGRRAFAIGNATTFSMSGAVFAGAYLVAEEFQFARHYSPVSTGLRLLPFFGMPMVISPLAGALSDKTGSRPVMVTGPAHRAHRRAQRGRPARDGQGLRDQLHGAAPRRVFAIAISTAVFSANGNLGTPASVTSGSSRRSPPAPGSPWPPPSA